MTGRINPKLKQKLHNNDGIAINKNDKPLLKNDLTFMLKP
jgi:hypothetical protein